jgi:hypothetical protein
VNTEQKKSNAKKALLLLFAVNLLNFFDRQLPGVLGEPIRKEFGLDDAQLGLIGTAFTLMYAAVGLPIGRLADTWVRTRLVSAGLAVWSALTAVSGVVHSYSGLVVARLGVGIGEATCSPACQSLIGDLFPARETLARARRLHAGFAVRPVPVVPHRRVAGRRIRLAHLLRARSRARVHRRAADTQTTRATRVPRTRRPSRSLRSRRRAGKRTSA